jgi:predicted nucleotidyltransferase component of viral defense system
MLNKEKHKFVMVQILKDIYSDVEISSMLGFKGGTAAFLFYDLPRFSVDLDFDLLDPSEKNADLLFEKIKKIVSKYGEIKDSQKKIATIFFALSYEVGQHQIKVEINMRKTGAHYEMLSYLGIPLLVADKNSMLGGKLVALTERKNFAARDLFDVHFFLKQNWEIERDVLDAYGIKSVSDYLEKCIALVERIPDSKMLAGLGELIDEKQKSWAKSELKKDTLFLLRLALENERKK